MKTQQKITPTIAKALASKVYSELKQKANIKNEDNNAKRFKTLKEDSQYKQWKLLLKEAEKLEISLEKQYKCSLNPGWKDSISLKDDENYISIPSEETIKTDIMLASFSQGEQLTSEQLIKKFVKQYSEK